MPVPAAENPFAVLTLIAAPAVFTNASSVLALGTGNRLARVVDRTRVLAHELHSTKRDQTSELWVDHLGRLQRRGSLLVRAMSFFYGSIAAFAAASLVSILGAVLAFSPRYQLPFEVLSIISFVAGTIGFIALTVGCVFLVRETRIALAAMSDEVHLAKSLLR